jgi:hypothetical protein
VVRKSDLARERNAETVSAKLDAAIRLFEARAEIGEIGLNRKRWEKSQRFSVFGVYPIAKHTGHYHSRLAANA